VALLHKRSVRLTRRPVNSGLQLYRRKGDEQTMIDFDTLEKGATYVVKRMFTDFYGNVFSPGEVLTYAERHFLPYHGGHTIVFRERSLYLQEEENRDIIDCFADYLSRAED
jgi:hypothetical protein